MLTQVWNEPNLSRRIRLVFKTELVLNRIETMLQKSALIYPSASNCTIFPRVNLGLKKIDFAFLFQNNTSPTCFDLILQNSLFNSITLQPSGKPTFFPVQGHFPCNAIYTPLSPPALEMRRASCSAAIPPTEAAAPPLDIPEIRHWDQRAQCIPDPRARQLGTGHGPPAKALRSELRHYPGNTG